MRLMRGPGGGSLISQTPVLMMMSFKAGQLSPVATGRFSSATHSDQLPT